VTDVCRSCGAPIVWARTDSGKRMPVDADPSEDGTLVLEQAGAVLRAHVVGTVPGEGSRHRAHFATCPDAESWRKR
jgi:hypothetical protein